MRWWGSDESDRTMTDHDVLEAAFAVQSLRTLEDGVAVAFAGPAALYRLAADAPGFAAAVAALRESLRTGEPLTVRLAGELIVGVG